MKKLMTAAIFALLALGVYLHAQLPQRREPLPLSPYRYEGSLDDIYWPVEGGGYAWATQYTTLGQLARYSDIIGVGHVSQRTNDNFIVTVDHALVGCTNGAAILMYAGWENLDGVTGGELPDDWPLFPYFPTNLSRIVFAVCTNYHYDGRMFWNHAEIPEEPYSILDFNALRHLNRSWWYADRDDGMLFTQFTNVLQAVRFDRNWTNYFYLCRDAANSTSNRVREDSFSDLRSICVYATDEQEQFILDDPLVDQKHKNWLISRRTRRQGN